MRITPRKEEVQEVVKVLESPDFSSADDLAKAVIKTVADLFEKRDWFAVFWRSNKDAFALGWGPFPSEAEARKFPVPDGQVGTFMLNPVVTHLERMATAETIKRICPNCSHPIGAHEHEKRAGQCQIDGCKCRSFK